MHLTIAKKQRETPSSSSPSTTSTPPQNRVGMGLWLFPVASYHLWNSSPADLRARQAHGCTLCSPPAHPHSLYHHPFRYHLFISTYQSTHPQITPKTPFCPVPLPTSCFTCSIHSLYPFPHPTRMPPSRQYRVCVLR